MQQCTLDVVLLQQKAAQLRWWACGRDGGTGRHAPVSARAELSSVATALDELARRVAAIGEGLTGAERDALSADLFEVERALGNASRRLGKALDNR